MPEENKKNWVNIVISFILLIIAIAVIAIVNKITTPKIVVEKPVINENPAASTTEIIATSSDLRIGGNTEIINDDIKKFNSYNLISIYPNGVVTPSDYIQNPNKSLDGIAKNIVITGNISDAYIYIKAGANDENGNFTSIKKQYDGIWFYLRNGKFLGGQLELSKSVFGQTSELTELLYNLKNVSVAENLDAYRNNKYVNKNLLSELNGERKIGALVSTSRYGRIEKVILAYKCAENNACNVEIR